MKIIRFALHHRTPKPVPSHLSRNLDKIWIDYFNSLKLIIKALITQFELLASLCVLSMGFDVAERGDDDDDYDGAPCFVVYFKLSHLPLSARTKRLVPRV